MRTTVTLDPDVMRLVEDAVHEQRRSRKHVINDALRRALTPQDRDQEPYELIPHHAVVQPGIDPARLNQLADELEDEATLSRLGSR
jgi:hypothetical protein